MTRVRRWIWVAGKRNILNGDRTVAFADNWKRWTASIIANGFAAPVLGRSELIDVEHDAQRAPIIGNVIRYKVLTREAALSKGFAKQRDEEALYALCDIDDDVSINHISPAIFFDWIDDNGTKWPAVVQHIAVVGQPAQQYAQPLQSELAAISLRRQEMPKTKKAALNVEVDEGALVDAEQVTDEVADAGDSLQSALNAANEELSTLRARVAELEAIIADLTSEAPKEGVNDAELRARVAKLEQHHAQLRVAELSKRFGIDGVEARKFASLSDAQIASIEALLTKQPATQARLSRGYDVPAKKATLSVADIDRKAHALAASENISYTAALRRVTAEA